VAAQFLRERINPADKFSHRHLDRIERESNVLLDLSERIARPFKEIGRLFELMPIDIENIINEEINRIKPDLNTIEITKDLTSELPRVLSVDFQLHQVLHDIISNAVEAMSGQESGELLIRGRCDKKNNRVVIEISDTGPGIRDEVRNKLFTPGITTKKGKLGIGLWWCRTFMRATDGDVKLKNTRTGKTQHLL
jgi:two-component system sensor kinase FixL